MIAAKIRPKIWVFIYRGQNTRVRDAYSARSDSTFFRET